MTPDFLTSVSRENKPYADHTIEPGFAGKCVSPKRSPLGFYVRCGRCSKCTRARQYSWYFRAIAELWTAQATWFLTFTLAAQPSVASYGDVQKFLKRYRKLFQHTQRQHIRYLFVTEQHKSGVDHYHALIHVNADTTRRDLENVWTLGFSKCLLLASIRSSEKPHPINKRVDWNSEYSRRTMYTCKYVGKTGRIRASQRYGRGFEFDKLGIVRSSTGLDIPF